MTQGYYRYPTLNGDTLVFTCEDDLWSVNLAGDGICAPRRLTAGVGEAAQARFSPDGCWIAYQYREEGPAEVAIMPAAGGPGRRLTFFGGNAAPIGWRPDGQTVYVATLARTFTTRVWNLFEVPIDGGDAHRLPWGPGRYISHQPDGPGLVIARNSGDLARWKRYRGGTAGELWVDATGNGQFTRICREAGQPTSPMWLAGRIYFLADTEGIGNLYSCKPDGSDTRRHTDHRDYYARQATTDGTRIVYHAGADLYVYDPTNEASTLLNLNWQSASPQVARRFVDAGRYLDGADLHPEGHSLVLTTRGKPFALGNWAGPIFQMGEAQGVRYRLATHLPDGKQIVAVHDQAGEERLALGPADGSSPLKDLGHLDLGRVLELAVSPAGDRLAIANHRHELLVVTLPSAANDVAGVPSRDAATLTPIDQSPTTAITGPVFSPDGAWLAYARPLSLTRTALFLCEVATGKTHQVTEPVLADTAPCWDPDGRWLHFLSARVFDPVYDNLHFDLGFPRGLRPALLTLRADLPDPFVPLPDGAIPGTVKAPEVKAPEAGGTPTTLTPEPTPPKPVQIDLDGIARRVAVYPVPEGKYTQILGLADKALFISTTPHGALERDWPMDSNIQGTLSCWDFATRKLETWAEQVAWAKLGAKAKHLLLFAAHRLRVTPAHEKPKDGQEAGREHGWVDLGRVRVEVDPRAEWRQMYREAWRLQRDQFWTANMSQVDWQQVHDLYLPLLDRLASRGEFSDLMWEVQGELGTSHAYEIGGDYRPVPRYDQGLLGAEYAWDATADGWRITHIVQGEAGDSKADSPLNRVGVNVAVGDVLTAINGRKLSASTPPDALLVHQARCEVALTVLRPGSAAAGGDKPAVSADSSPDAVANPLPAGSVPVVVGEPRTVSVTTLASEGPARYREWVESNRQKVHAATNGRCGYIHIPDMGPWGFGEFHRSWLSDADRDALVVDVRYNGGGHVSQLILERLARKRLGYDVPRWGLPVPFPDQAQVGPIVAITNEIAGSDGDIFSHCFKLMKLGPLIGTRTWGGVIGIWPRHPLVDGTFTTQPEFSFWFHDVKWGVENYGTDPDITVEVPPHAYAAGIDPQLERAIAEALQRLEANPIQPPDLANRPNLARPTLPHRG